MCKDMQTLQAWNELLSTVFFSTVLAFSVWIPHGPMGTEATLAPGRLGVFPRKLETGRGKRAAAKQTTGKHTEKGAKLSVP